MITNFTILTLETEYNGYSLVLAIITVLIVLGYLYFLRIKSKPLVENRYIYYPAKIYMSDPDPDRALQPFSLASRGKSIRMETSTNKWEMDMGENDGGWVTMSPGILTDATNQMSEGKKTIELNV